MNKLNISLIYQLFYPIAVFLVASVLSSYGRTFSEIVAVEIPTEFSEETRNAFVGDWENEDQQVKLIVESVKPDGTAKVKVLSDDSSTIKKATVERVAGTIPFLIIEMKDGDKLSGLYNLTLEDGQLVGSFENLSNGDFQDLAFKLMPKKEPNEKLSQNMDS
ncbi:hypothetical protein [Rubellicoccus peritrichatus]|uniref:Uncharacterized protein n=1 Tax=Rubellicoccus peritrichatus TaxID=3080537 RepID=A0AAQ3L7A1_9BACT|nr:hypothetical protein [Puniceicoccus sp. CR14]WOO40356.1 hypothetical protein RZN69_17190 [Puniceicoccus sp. CR14]